MALTPCALEMCTRSLGTDEPYCTGRPARPFFMLEARGPHGTAGRAGAQSLPRREVGFRDIGHVAHQSPPHGSGATAHVAASEPFSPGRRVPEPRDTWWRTVARPTLFLDLKLVCGGTRSARYRQWPPDPPQGKRRTRRWGQLLFPRATFLNFHLGGCSSAPLPLDTWQHLVDASCHSAGRGWRSVATTVPRRQWPVMTQRASWVPRQLLPQFLKWNDCHVQHVMSVRRLSSPSWFTDWLTHVDWQAGPEPPCYC
jgi:hypothetical protein